MFGIITKLSMLNANISIWLFIYTDLL